MFEEILLQTLEALPLGVVLVGRDKVIRWANSEALRLFGAEDPEELVGKRCQTYLCPSDLCPVMDEGKVLDRSERVLLKAFLPLSEEGIFKSYFEAVFEGTRAMMLMLDEDLVVTKVNSAVLQHTGYLRSEIVGQSVTRLVHPDDLPLLLQRHQRRVKGEPVPSS